MYLAVLGDQIESVKLLLSLGSNVKDKPVRRKLLGCFRQRATTNGEQNVNCQTKGVIRHKMLSEIQSAQMEILLITKPSCFSTVVLIVW